MAYVDEYVRLVAMLHFPEVQAKAQAEIDKAVGRSRIPEFSDMDSLPYTMAVIKEVDATTIGTVSEKGYDGFLYALYL